jgi:ArsR family transcriptional regulator
MATTKKMVELERLFQALGDATRLRILGLLLTGEVCVCDIHETLKIPQPKASRHLAYLRRSGLVATRRDGLWVHYRLADVADPVLSAIAIAVRHALTHVDVVRHDAERLQKKTGCCAPTRKAIAGLPCCEPVGGDRVAH